MNLKSGNRDPEKVTKQGEAVSSTLTSEGINVCFNSMQGLAHRPIAHMCSCMIELPVTYVTYLEFLNEFRSILMSGDDFVWIMNAL